MAPPNEKVIFYGYAASPMWMKMRSILVLRRIPHSLVNVTGAPPRPALLQMGITYRRIPVMTIGNDVIFDTALMISKLERLFKPEDGFPSILSKDGGVDYILGKFFADRALFQISAAFIPGQLLSEDFKKDRKAFNPAMNFDKLQELVPQSLSDLRPFLMLIQNQLATSSSPFLLGGSAPTLADISAHTLITWAIKLRTASSVLVLPSSKAPPEYRKVMEWVETIQALLDSGAKDPANPGAKASVISGDEAARIAVTSAASGLVDGKKVQVDTSDPLIKASWLKEGDAVEVTPTDTGRVPQLGRLEGLTSETVSIRIAVPAENGNGEGKTLMGHFPRIGYSVKRVPASGGVKGKL